MRIPWYFVAIICATILSPCCKKLIEPASCLPSNLQNGVLAFYPLSNGSLNDAVNNHHLSNTTTAKPSLDRAGNPKCAFEFKNTPSINEFLNIKNPTFLDNPTESSISFWFMPLDTFIYQNNNSCNSGGNWWFALQGKCFKVGFHVDNKSLVFGQQCSSSNDIGKWYHIVVTSKKNTLQAFINGVLLGTCKANSDNIICHSNLLIGEGFTGVIDDVILYNRELTVAEVKQLQNLPTCCE